MYRGMRPAAAGRVTSRPLKKLTALRNSPLCAKCLWEIRKSMCDLGLVFDSGVPLRYPDKLQGLDEGSAANITLQRNECINAIADAQGTIDWLSRIDSLTKYAESLLGILQGCEGREPSGVAVDLVITLINAASYYQEISLDTMERAYGTPMATPMWSTSGKHLRKGLGLLQFVMSPSSCGAVDCIPTEARAKFFKLINEMVLEFQFLQQIGVVVLSLSKLRARVYRDQRDAILDFQESDLNELSNNSLLYARLVIGCFDTALKRENDTGSIINKPVLSYLNGLIFLLLSLDQYSKDECGVAVGMIDLTISYLQRIVPQAQLSESVISEKRKKRDILKTAFQRSKYKSSTATTINTNSFKVWSKKSKKNQLLPLLKETLDDFLVHLTILLRYRYIQTNEKLTFKPVERKESVLRKKFPRGTSPALQGSEWIFDPSSLSFQELATAPNSGTVKDSNSDSNGYY